jgi:hypothetical protein
MGHSVRAESSKGGLHDRGTVQVPPLEEEGDSERYAGATAYGLRDVPAVLAPQTVLS